MENFLWQVHLQTNKKRNKNYVFEKKEHYENVDNLVRRISDLCASIRTKIPPGFSRTNLAAGCEMSYLSLLGITAQNTGQCVRKEMLS